MKKDAEMLAECGKLPFTIGGTATDKSTIPFDKHQGKMLRDVPADYIFVVSRPTLPSPFRFHLSRVIR